MKASTFFVIAWAISISAFAQTSAPAAPTLTAGAEFKGLRGTPTVYTTLPEIDIFADKMEEVLKKGLPA